MSASSERRVKRQMERLKEKIHKKFVEKTKGMTDEQVLWELEKIRHRYGLEWKRPEGVDNLIIDPVDVEIV